MESKFKNQNGEINRELRMAKVNPKFENLSPKQEQITKVQSQKVYDLEDRTFLFARNVIEYAHKISKTLSNIEICKQLIRAAGSVGANYIEASESLGKKDFFMRIKISRKEAKETRYWLRLVEASIDSYKERDKLINEATELTKIFGSIVSKAN